METMKQICILLLLGLSFISAQRETILRTNWGVHFDEIGSVISQYQLSYYMHSFAIPKPHLTHDIIKMLNCTNHMSWYVLCDTINNAIKDNNINNYELFSYSAHEIEQVLSMIPKRDNTTIQKIVNDHSKRQKRNIFTSIKNAFKSVGNAFADLFHIPGPRDRDILISHLKEVNEAMKQNSDAVKLFDNDLSSTQVLFDNRISNLMSGLQDVQNDITDMGDEIHHTFSDINIELQNILNRTNILSGVRAYITSKFIPALFQKRLIIDEMLEVASQWYQGIFTLYEGELSDWIIPHENIEHVIRHIRTNILTQSRYANLKLLNEQTDFYYQQKDIIVTEHEDVIVVMVKFPLKQIGGELKVYSAYTFPVPLSVGLKQPSIDSYTEIKDIPSYIAITDDGEYYLTMNSELYASCVGEGIKICKLGMGALQHSSTVTCMSALYFDDSKGIHSKCDIEIFKKPPIGTARQLVGVNNTFLIHAALGGEDMWRLRCDINNKYTQQVLKPCSMCRMQMPCFCTFASTEFELGSRMTQCALKTDSDSYPEITYLHHINLAMINSLFPKNALSDVHGYEAKINDLYPSLNISLSPIIKSNWSDISNKDDILRQDFKKVSKATLDKVIAYESKEDAIQKKVKDFSDVTVGQTTDLLKAVRDLFGIFGSFGHVIGFIFSELGLSLIALCLSSILCMPMFCWHMYMCCKCCKKRSRKERNWDRHVQYLQLNTLNES